MKIIGKYHVNPWWSAITSCFFLIVFFLGTLQSKNGTSNERDHFCYKESKQSFFIQLKQSEESF